MADRERRKYLVLGRRGIEGLARNDGMEGGRERAAADHSN